MQVLETGRRYGTAYKNKEKSSREFEPHLDLKPGGVVVAAAVVAAAAAVAPQLPLCATASAQISPSSLRPANLAEMLFCALSGEPVHSPVVSPGSGRVFEQSIIEAYIHEHHSDPFTKTSLRTEDLVPFNPGPECATPLPNTPALAGIPSLLSALKTEYDGIVLGAFELRQQNSELRTKLSEALYKCDAATRVIARLVGERDEAREALSLLGQPLPELKGSAATAAASKAEEDGVEHNSDNWFTALLARTATRLRAERLQLPKSEPCAAKVDTIAAARMVASGDRKLVLCADGRVYLKESDGSETEIEPNTQGSVDIALNGSTAAVLFDNNLTVRHEGKQTSIALETRPSSVAVHPTGYIAELDGAQLIFRNMDGETVHSAPLEPAAAKSPLQFSADGEYAIYATETETVLWSFEENGAAGRYSGPADQIAVSQNGYLVAWTCSHNVSLLDLRTDDGPISIESSGSVSCIGFSDSGNVLVLGGTGEFKLHAKGVVTDFDSGLPAASLGAIKAAVAIDWTGAQITCCSSKKGPAKKARAAPKTAAKSGENAPRTRNTRSKAAAQNEPEDTEPVTRKRARRI